MQKMFICPSITILEKNGDNHTVHINICLKSDALLIQDVLIWSFKIYTSICYPLHDFIIKRGSERWCSQTGRVCLQISICVVASTQGWERQRQDRCFPDAEVQVEMLNGAEEAATNEDCSLYQGQPCSGRDCLHCGLSVISESLMVKHDGQTNLN